VNLKGKIENVYYINHAYCKISEGTMEALRRCFKDYGK